MDIFEDLRNISESSLMRVRMEGKDGREGWKGRDGGVRVEGGECQMVRGGPDIYMAKRGMANSLPAVKVTQSRKATTWDTKQRPF